MCRNEGKPKNRWELFRDLSILFIILRTAIIEIIASFKKRLQGFSALHTLKIIYILIKYIRIMQGEEAIIMEIAWGLPGYQ